jgi:hypothetical protein
MLKAADALSEAGYDVRVVSACFSEWAHKADLVVRRTRNWRWSMIDYSKFAAPLTALTTSARWRFATKVAAIAPERVPWWAVTRAYSRIHGELTTAALSEAADFYYGGTTGGLAPTAEAAARAHKPYALDLEDWHTGERSQEDGALQHALAARIERQVLPSARFLTTSSEAMTQAYEQRYNLRATTIHNVFSLPATKPALDAGGDRLRVCWFGQTIGPGRGVEHIADIAIAANVPIDLDIRGRLDEAFGTQLRDRVKTSSQVRLTFLPPLDPDALVDWCRGYDVGVYADPPLFENRLLCLSNKVFTYLLAGLAVLSLQTPAQQPLVESTGSAIRWFAPGDVSAAAAALRQWSECRASLRRSREDSWAAATTRWHWEHTAERGRLVELVGRALA